MLDKQLLVLLCDARERLRCVDEESSIPEVARAAGLSPYHFIRLFKAVFGETPHRCRVQARLARAKYLLTMGDYSVTRVCMEVGFSSLGSFSMLFLRRVGLSPSAYKRKMRPLAHRPGQLPRQLVPGCFDLMGAFPP